MEIGRIQPVPTQQGFTGQSNRNFKQDNQEVKVENQVIPEPSGLQSEKDIIKAVEGLNKMFESTNTHLQFTYHEELGEYYVKIINDMNNEVLKEIPSKKVLDMVAEMGKALGLIVDKKV